MGDDNHGAPVVQKIILQPFDGVQVQVVGRLVKEHDVWRREQELAEGDPGLLASGQIVYRFGEFFVRKPESAKHSGNLTFPRVAACLLELCLRLVITLHQNIQFISRSMIHLQFHGAQTFFHRDQVLHHFGNFVINRLAAGEHILLGQISDGRTARDRHFTFIGRFFTHDNAQQCRLAGPVDADDCCFLMFLYVK